MLCAFVVPTRVPDSLQTVKNSRILLVSFLTTVHSNNWFSFDSMKPVTDSCIHSEIIATIHFPAQDHCLRPWPPTTRTVPVSTLRHTRKNFKTRIFYRINTTILKLATLEPGGALLVKSRPSRFPLIPLRVNKSNK